jgi:hypothetical protein
MPDDRPKVGPADPETRRRLLEEKLNEPTKATGVAAKTPPPPKKKKGTTLGGLLDPNVKRERRVAGDDESLSDAVDRGVREASEDDK